MRPQTIFLSRMFGVYCLMMGLLLLMRRELIRTTVAALVRDYPLMLVLAILLVFAGLAMVLVHNIWKGGPAPVIVTVFGWLTLLKGVLMLYLAPENLAGFYMQVFDHALYVYLDATVILVLGAYLTFIGFQARQAKHA